MCNSLSDLGSCSSAIASCRLPWIHRRTRIAQQRDSDFGFETLGTLYLWNRLRVSETVNPS